MKSCKKSVHRFGTS